MDNEKKRSILDKIAELLPNLSTTALDTLLSFVEWLGFCDKWRQGNK